MTHNFVGGFQAAEQLICKTHGAATAECRAAHQATNAATLGGLGLVVGGALGGRDGAAIGAIVGGLLGLAQPSWAAAARQLELNRRAHGLA